MLKNRPEEGQLVDGILKADRVMLGRAITLAESTVSSDKQLIGRVIKKLYNKTGNAIRFAVSGPPGAGKSSLIEVLGKFLTAKGFKVAVLSVDPSSPVSGGSILGDKTRMEELSKDPLAFIRPSSAGKTLGGLSSSTKEAILLCEAAGYDFILVETVGVGQSEIEAVNLCDYFILVLITGAGDDLQAIKMGIMEVPDVIVVNKADETNKKEASRFMDLLKTSLHLKGKTEVELFMTSTLLNEGIQELTSWILTKKETGINESIKKRRENQNLKWFYTYLKEELWNNFINEKAIKEKVAQAETAVKEGRETPSVLSEALINLFKEK